MSRDFLGKGLKFPFAFAKRSGGPQISTVTTANHAHIHESILQILGTRPGERFMNPEFGSHVRDLVFESNDTVLKGLLQHYIIDAIEQWEKRIVVTDVSFDDSSEVIDSYTLYICISYRIIDAQVDGNIIWPFCREMLTGE